MARNVVQFQKGLSEPAFEQQYGTEEQCRAIVIASRWPRGFECPACGGRQYCVVTTRDLYQCAKCRRQTSPIAGTIFASTHLPLRLWFRAIYHLTQTKQGISSIELGRRLGVTQTTAWKIKHKLKQVMLERDATKRLTGRIEIDDAYLGGERSGGKRGRGAPGKTPFVAAVETTTEGKPIRLKLRRVTSFCATSIAGFAKRSLDPDCSVVSDGLQCFAGVADAGCAHQVIKTGSGPKAARTPAFKWVNTALGNIKAAITGTYRAINSKHFYAPTTLTDFAAGIDAMVQVGVNIIVDDLSNTEEPFFQVAGPLDTAIQNAIDAGVNYFTSADNYGNAYYAAAFKPKTTTLPGVTGSVSAQVFSNGTTLQTITITLQSIIALQWDAPFSTAGGTPQALSMVLYQNGKAIKSATQVADPGSGFANEPEIAMGGVVPGTYQLAIYQTAGMPKVSTFKYSLFGSGTGTGPGGYIDDPAAMNGIGNVFGHGLVPGVNTVASVDWANTPAFLGNSTFTEPASDDGPGELLFDSNGNRLAKPLADGKPNFTAPDGVSMTPDLTGFQPFYGTSAAAPDAAAVAALMLQANPNLTPAQVTSDLEASAVSLGLSADRQGAGLVQAVGAVKLALAPAQPSVPDLAAASDSGVSHTDNITKVTTPTFNGKGDVGSTVTLYDGSTVIGTTKVDATGNWSIKSSLLSAGVHAIKAQASDTGGDTSAFTQPLSVTIDTTAPAAPSVPDLAAASDSGVSNTDNITNVTTPVFSGKSAVGSTVTLFDGSTAVGTAKADATGNWSIKSSLLSVGARAIKAQASDTAGNASTFTQSLSVTIDSTAPAVPSVPDLAAVSDSGVSNSDNITKVTTPIFTGKGDVGSTVTLYDGSTVIGTTKAGTAGNWSIKSSLLSTGVHAIKAQANDTAGNASAFTQPLSVTIDTTAPAVPTVSDLAAASDSGVSNTDNVTNVTTPIFIGKSDIGSTVTLYDGSTAVGIAKANATGNWSIKSSLLSAGVHAIKAQASDAAGNASAFTQSLSVTIDSTAPAVPSVPDLAAVSDSGVSNSDNITKVDDADIHRQGRCRFDGDSL